MDEQEPSSGERRLVYGAAGSGAPRQDVATSAPTPDHERPRWHAWVIACAIGAAIAVGIGVAAAVKSAHNHQPAPVPHAGLQCAAPIVTADDAPFCYQLPVGFREVSATANFAETDPYRTMVQPVSGSARRDVIVVVAHRSDIDFDRFDSARLLAFEHEATPAVGSSGIVTVGTLRRVARPPGQGRGDVVTIKYSDGTRSELARVYDSHTVVTVKCQELTDPVAVDSACSTVMATLRVLAMS